MGYQGNISIAERHAGASEGERMEQIHDLHSLQVIISSTDEDFRKKTVNFLLKSSV